MIKNIKTSKFSKILACYLAIQLIITTVQPTNLFALTGGPAQPEFNSFTPIGTSDMVNLSSGDFNYNIPIMDVGGYPLNLSYDSGISMDQEATWVGLGWNLNIGQINRQVRGLPDDFNGDGVDGDKLTYVQKQKKNKTTGMTFFINGQAFGFEGNNAAGESQNNGSVNAALTVQHNNYEGISVTPSLGFAFSVGDVASVGMNLSSSVTDGVSFSPRIGITKSYKDNKDKHIDGYNANLGAGFTYNSRQGLNSFNINTSLDAFRIKDASKPVKDQEKSNFNLIGSGGRISFSNHTFTPKKRSSYHNSSFTFDASTGLDFWGIDAEVGVTAFGTQQKIIEPTTYEKAYGYENTRYASKNDVLDFNRENDVDISKNTLVLPTVNYTYDLYSIQGQGTGGQFRPYKSQVGYLFDKYVEDTGASGQLGVEVEGATGFHFGVDLKYTDIQNHTGVWNTPAKSFFEYDSNNKPDYEETYFKSTGDLNVDNNINMFNQLGGEKPIALNIVKDGERSYGKYATNQFRQKNAQVEASTSTLPNNTTVETNNFDYTPIPIAQSIKRQSIDKVSREKRNQAILRVSNKEAQHDPFVVANNLLKPHHTNGIKVTNPDGATYIYGESATNISKDEITFSVNGNATDLPNGLTTFSDQENSPNNNSGVDNYYNRVNTPSYAHSFLLTSVLSSDYEDVTGDGISDDDLGAYTKIYYNDFSDDFSDPTAGNEIVSNVSSSYNWRVPYDITKATYSPGFNTNPLDQKASIIQGSKELKYATKIETKTHIALLDFSKREDGKSAINQESQLRVMAIRLYSKPEYKELVAGNNTIQPIKTAHFEYDYSLMPKTPNSIASGKGKLTLKRLYFTYRGSEMGKYTPYVFNYDNLNPDYQIKSYDIWGNYKPLYENGQSNSSNCEAHNGIMASEFPYVQQQDKALQDNRAAAWTLSSIDLPSGGKIELQYESDDYQYVQNKKAMQMFKILGVSDTNDFDNPMINSSGESILYDFARDAKYILVELPNETNAINQIDFIERYLGEHYNKPIYFNFLTNMEKNKNCSYDYVSGYFEIDKDTDILFYNSNNNHPVAAIPMKTLNMEGSNKTINPISKAGWYFGRKNLNRYVYGVADNTPENASLEDIVQQLGQSLGSMLHIFRAPNYVLRNEQFIAKKFVPEKSWLRLQHPGKAKLGGGLRVKQVVMHDNWDVMNNESSANSIYANFYGQEYDYNLEDDGGSSGVATWEPNVSKENPFVEPFYNNPEKLVAPKEVNYVEKPFGESFFPAPIVTYSRVTVSNLKRDDGINEVKKHATGKVVNEFYTSKEFPTIVDYTEIDDPLNYKSNLQNVGNALLSSVLGISRTKTELALSQGFSIVTNDMNGKSKSQKVYDERGNLVSGVDYKYNTSSNGTLDNNLPVILEDGSIKKQLIGTHYDVITDFRESYNHTVTRGLSLNAAAFVIGIVPIFAANSLYAGQDVKSTLHTTTVTKVIHKTGILKEKIAYDLGAKVSTKNLAWDAGSGQVLLTETTNEYDDNYFNFSYPAHWMYENMGQASSNLGIELIIEPTLTNPEIQGQSGDEQGYSAWYGLVKSFYDNDVKPHHYINVGDEVDVYNYLDDTYEGHYWINEIKNGKIILINVNGKIFNPCGDDTSAKRIKVVRSAKRNLQTASMATVTAMSNPFDANNDDNSFDEDDFTNLTSTSFFYDGNNENPKIINSSAVKYKDFWRPQSQLGVSDYPENVFLDMNGVVKYPYLHNNPFVNNIKGDWRASKSYAFLTGRTNNDSPRNDGFYNSFFPFYIYSGKFWQINPLANASQNNNLGWTYASEVSKFSPFGIELENKDALNRYSAAQYGYNYTLPTAVASNSEYREIGYDGFESYDAITADTPNRTKQDHFSFRNSINQVTGVERTTATAHSGKYSIKVPTNSKASLNTSKFLGSSSVVNTINCAPPIDDTNGCVVYRLIRQEPSDSNNENVPIDNLGNASFSYTDCNNQSQEISFFVDSLEICAIENSVLALNSISEFYTDGNTCAAPSPCPSGGAVNLNIADSQDDNVFAIPYNYLFSMPGLTNTEIQIISVQIQDPLGQPYIGSCESATFNNSNEIFTVDFCNNSNISEYTFNINFVHSYNCDVTSVSVVFDF